MGIQESRVQLCTQEQYRKDREKKMDHREQLKKRQSFFKIQQCQYPHPLMQKQYKHNHRQSHESSDHQGHRCTMKHAGYPDTYNLCSKCEQNPQKMRKDPKVSYVHEGYSLAKPQPVKYDYKPTKYKQKDVLAPGPQIPTFYNGFSLPIDRYYKQKTQYTDYYPEPQRGESPYRQESKSFEESVYEEEVSERRHSIQHEREIDFGGHVQNLKL